jgi:C4-dicarboxylate-specific signal transduction histidine kinase
VPNPVHEASAVTAEWVSSAPKQPARDSEPRCHETQAGLASAKRVAIPEQLSTSIAEINQPISAIVMNAEAALQLVAQPADTDAVRRLLACIVKDGMRTGEIVSRTRALIRENTATKGNVTS